MRTNKGTRGLDAFSEETYIPTKLDMEISPRILSGKYRLVIITGTAGDGKTAFIQKLEKDIKQRRLHFEGLPNGSKFRIGNITFETNYDGSQDEGSLQNEEVLGTFFEPFIGNPHSWPASTTRIIGVNEGRLTDFFTANYEKFKLLSNVLIYKDPESQRSVEGYLLVLNLNDRSIVDGDPLSGSDILARTVSKFVEPRFWSYCDSCDIKEKCYIKYNVDTFSDASLGRYVASRAKVLFQIIYLRKKMHITIRDLRSALSFILFGKLTCEQIHTALESDWELFLRSCYFNSIFSGEFEDDPSVIDRVMRMLSEIDVSRVSNPRLDNDINFVSPSSLTFRPSDKRSKFDMRLLKELFDQRPSEPITARVSSIFAKYHKTIRRKLFFEDPSDTSCKMMLPFERLFDFLDIVSGRAPASSARDLIVSAMSMSEKMFDERIRSEYVCIRGLSVKGSRINSFTMFRKSQFKSEISSQGEKLVETLPNCVIFRFEDSGISLEVTLDLYELLLEISRGFVPSVDQLRGLYPNMLIFKRQLAAAKSNNILLQSGEGYFFEVQKIGDSRIEISPALGGGS